MRRPIRLVLLLACTLLAGCAVLSLLTLPFKLLFRVVEGIAGGIGSIGTLTSSAAFIDVHEGAAPRLIPLGDGQFTVDGVVEGARFDVVVTAPDRETRRYRWPDDLSGLVPSDGGVVEVECVLRPALETE